MSKLFLTYGTYEYLSRIMSNIEDKECMLLENEDKALLLYETTEQNPVFHEGLNFTVLESYHSLRLEKGFVVLNHIPVTSEGKPLFESIFNNISDTLKKLVGLKALRILQPETGSTYVILTVWENKQKFTESSKNNNDVAKAINQQSDFPSPSYISTYHIKEPTVFLRK